MAPPLVGELMCGDEVGEVDVVGLLYAADEADAFRERDGVGEGLGEVAVARELEDAELVELVGAVVFLVVGEAGLGGGDHVIDVVGVVRVVVDLDVDGAVDALVDVAFDVVAGGDVGEEVEDLDVAHAVGEVVAAVLVPVALEVAGRDGDLGLAFGVVVRGADDGVVGDPVGVLGEEVGAAAEGVAALGEILYGAEVFFATAAWVGEFEVGGVADGGEVAAVKEGAGVGELGALAAIAEAARAVADVEVHVHFFAGSEGLIERVDGVEIALGGGDFVEGAVELDVGDGLLGVDDVDLRDGVRGFVLEDEVAGAGEGAALGEDVDVGVDGDDLGLREGIDTS